VAPHTVCHEQPVRMDEKQITHNIRRLRLEKKMSLAQLAKHTGLTKGTVYRIENASKAPPVSTLTKIANALNIDVNKMVVDSSGSHENLSLCIVRKEDRKEVLSGGRLYGYL